MINLYYCLDPGVLESLKEDFVRENLNYQVISCESFENLFGSLEQNSLFDAPEAFIINNPIFLTNKWKEMREKDNDSKSNNLQIDRFVRIMQHLKMSNINVLILVYSPSLLTNKSIKGLLDLVDNSDHKKEVLNARTKKAFIDNLIKKIMWNLKRI
ncbi:hypothetical protein [Mycoplasmoides fastidiosum]|uniref:hypothetical protein n=1 Tax=Mycoplasmoides fastidiosum TaxID=92758 RepID=UPI002115C0DE|nr:hypothetical protein [Mycoplasmoides fastidiosum]UUD37805.1 hypothetical protein NPA10_00185 [Mycoplasmoides fastidiosum]